MGVEDQAAFIQFMEVDTLFHPDRKVFGLLLKLQEIVLQFTFKDAHCIYLLVVEQGICYVNHIKFPAFNMRMCRLIIKVGSQLSGVLVGR